MSDTHKKGHDYHLVDPSVWPIAISFSALVLAIGAVYFMHSKSLWLLLIGLALTLYCMFMWFRDVVIEGEHKGINTLILLLSGTTVTWAHHSLLENDRKGLLNGLLLTVILGLIFTSFQAYEYFVADFKLSSGIYGATFYMATGFHGFHVLVGTIFLAVCYFRAKAGHYKPDHHFGFEAAAWYWHFVDVVWLFLFASIYIWGS